MTDSSKKNNGVSPYYIYAPNYVSTSAGIKALYILCDEINKAGYEAYIASSSVTSDLYNAPLLKATTFLKHVILKKTPIVVYPEVVANNILRASFYVRYYFCFNAYFGVDLRDDKPNMVYSFSRDICDGDVVNTDHIMFIPTLDLSVFHPPEKEVKREGFCYAALKYKYFYNEKIFGIPEGGIEITRNLPDSQSKEEIAELFRKCKYFYCFDNSALALEATLCGCTTIIMKNKHFTKLIGETELNGLPGIARDVDDEAIAKAEQTVQYAYSNYLNVVALFKNDITLFIQRTQSAVSNHCDTSKWNKVVFFSKVLILRIKNVIRNFIKKIYIEVKLRFPKLDEPLTRLVCFMRGTPHSSKKA